MTAGNVLQIMDYAAPYKGNFIPSLLNLEAHLNKSGFKQVYLFPESARNLYWIEELNSSGKSVYFIGSSFFSKKIKFSNISFLRGLIKKEKIAIIHTHFVAQNYTLAFMRLTGLLQQPVAGNFMNEFLPVRNKYYWLKVIATRLTFSVIIASSEAVRMSLEKCSIKDRKVRTIFNALDTGHLLKYENINFHDHPGQKVVLMFGWTFERKGVDLAVKAVKDLISRNYDIRLVIAMAGGIDIVREEIIKLNGSLPDWVTLKGPHPEVASYYNAADIFLSSSREEGFTYSVLEASFCNPLIVASDIGGHPLDIPGIGIFRSGDNIMLADVLMKILSVKEAEKDGIKKLQREYVMTKYNVNDWSENVISLFSTLKR